MPVRRSLCDCTNNAYQQPLYPILRKHGDDTKHVYIGYI